VLDPASGVLITGSGFSVSAARFRLVFANVAVSGLGGFEKEEARGLDLATIGRLWAIEATVGVWVGEWSSFMTLGRRRSDSSCVWWEQESDHTTATSLTQFYPSIFYDAPRLPKISFSFSSYRIRLFTNYTDSERR
jgi:hypothetical protein